MYCIKKYADCWAIFNLDNDRSRRLSEAEALVIREAIPSLNDVQVCSYFTDEVDCLDEKP